MNSAAEFWGDSIFQQMADGDDELWYFFTDPNYMSSEPAGYDPILNWDRDVPRILNKVIEFDEDHWGYSVDSDRFCEEYERETGFITTEREVAGYFDDIRLVDGKLISPFYPIPIELSEFEERLIEGATEHQKKIILHDRGSLCIDSVPGSGKTRVITHMVARKVYEGFIEPERVLMVTFTRRAAEVMRERLAGLIGNSAFQINAGTFHSTCLRLLKELKEDGPFWNERTEENDFEIVNEDKSIEIIGRFGGSRNATDISSCFQKSKLGIAEIPKKWITIFDEYQSYLHENRMLDYTDLLICMKEILENNKRAYDSIARKFDLVVIDESQDINLVQAELAKCFAGNGNIIAVGDESQAIYGFQGGSIDAILDPKTYLGIEERVNLPDNFRSRPQIIEVANSLIKHNKRRVEKPFRAVRKQTKADCVKVVDVNGLQGSVSFVRKQINEWVSMGYPFSEIVVLARTNKVLLDHYKQLQATKNKIPFDIGSVAFMKRAEIKDVNAYLRLLHDQYDTESFKRISKYLAGVGKKTVDALIDRLQSKSSLHKILTLAEVKLSKKAHNSLEEFNRFMVDLRRNRYDISTKELISEVIKEQGFSEGIRKDKARFSNVRRLIDIVDPDLMLSEYFSSLTDIEENVEFVKLRTVHAIKGSEAACVLLLQCNENEFPHYHAIESDDEDAIEEERRVMFVAITRAKDKLVILNNTRKIKSRFIEEMFASD